MGDDGSHSGNQGLKNLNKDWSLFWGRFVEDDVSESVNSAAQVQLEKASDRSQSLSLHKKLLDVEMENIHKEIEDLALTLSQESRQSPKALEIRKRLKELFLIEENLNIQVDSLQKSLSQTKKLQEDLVKGVS